PYSSVRRTPWRQADVRSARWLPRQTFAQLQSRLALSRSSALRKRPSTASSKPGSNCMTMTGARISTLPVIHPPFPSLAEMLSTYSLSVREGRAVSTVERRPWIPPASRAVSGSRFEQITSFGPDGESYWYVLKRITPCTVLVMHLSGDKVCRERLAWQ